MKRFSLLSISPLRRVALVVALHNAWFWVPIWVLYYRRFTNYGGVAFLEALSMGIFMAMIVPGGMLSDWIGRKRLLILAGALNAIGMFGAGIAWSFPFLVFSILLCSVAGGLYHASVHALIYDTLKSTHHEGRYEQVLGKFITVEMLSSAVASAFGGWMYAFDPRSPWFAVSVLTGISVFVAGTIQEPAVETAHDTFIQFVKEAGKGISLLLKKEWRIALPLLCVGIFLTTDSSGLWDIQAVEFGYSSTQLGILLTLAYAILAAVSAFVPRILRRFQERKVAVISAGFFTVLWALSSAVVGWMGGLLLISRSAASVIFDIKASVMWNRVIPSSIRATTLSVISIFRGIPYILVAWGMGTLLDMIGIRPIVRALSLMLCIVTGGMWFLWRSHLLKKE